MMVLLLPGLLASCASQDERAADDAKHEQRVDIHTRLGATYLYRNQLDVAQQELERALELDPDDSQANNVMGLLQIRLKNDDKAERHFRRAISEQGDNSEARNNYGVFLCERNRLDEADKQFRAALANQLYRTPEQAALNAGLCALRKPDKDAAAKYLRTALEKDPRLTPALYQMPGSASKRDRCCRRAASCSVISRSARTRPRCCCSRSASSGRWAPRTRKPAMRSGCAASSRIRPRPNNCARSLDDNNT